MQDFLLASSVVDFDSVVVRGLACELMSSGPTEGYAARCFNWVRDQVTHSADSSIDVVSCTASELALSRVGLCYAKSHLLVALLRAARIPSGFSYQRLSTDSGQFAYTVWYRFGSRE